MNNTFIDNKFKSFEVYLKRNYIESTKNSTKYVGILPGYEDAFMVFFLKDLLTYLEKLKKNAYPVVDKPLTASIDPGERAPIPIPKGGVGTIKAGKIPDLNLNKIIDELLSSSIKKFLESLSVYPNIVTILEKKIDELDRLELEDLNNIKTLYTANTKPFNPFFMEFDIRNYIHENEAIFITANIRKNIEEVHNKIVVPICKYFYSTSEECDASIINGILSIVSNIKSIPEFFKDYFMTGLAVEINPGSIGTEAVMSNLDIIPGLQYGLAFKNLDYGTIILTIPLTTHGSMTISSQVMINLDGIIVPKETLNALT